MRILIATTAFPRWPGDIHGVFILEEARALQAAGAQVSVVAMHAPGAAHHESIDGIEVIRPPYLPERWEIMRKETGGIPAMWRKNKLARLTLIPFALRHALAIAQFATRRQVDLIHANWTLSTLTAGLGQPLHRKPIVATVHGSDIYQGGRMTGGARLSRLALSTAHTVIAVSQSLRDETVKLGVPADKIVVVPDGIDTQRFAPATQGDGTPSERENLVVFAGSLIERKGVHFLLEAAAQVVAGVPNCRFVIAGDGILRESLTQHAEKLGLAGYVQFTGEQTQDQLRDWMQRASAFVLPSLEEGLGVVLLEAMACGTPCVGTRVGGIPDVVVPNTGLLVPPADATALAHAILQLLRDPACWHAFSLAARQRAQECYSWPVIAAQLMGVFERAAVAGRAKQAV